MIDLFVPRASVNRRLVLQHPNYRVLLLINATTSRPPALAVRIRQEPLDNDNLSDRPGTLSVSQDNTSKRGIAQKNKSYVGKRCMRETERATPCHHGCLTNRRLSPIFFAGEIVIDRRETR